MNPNQYTASHWQAPGLCFIHPCLACSRCGLFIPVCVQKRLRNERRGMPAAHSRRLLSFKGTSVHSQLMVRFDELCDYLGLWESSTACHTFCHELITKCLEMPALDHMQACHYEGKLNTKAKWLHRQPELFLFSSYVAVAILSFRIVDSVPQWHWLF